MLTCHNGSVVYPNGSRPSNGPCYLRWEQIESKALLRQELRELLRACSDSAYKLSVLQSSSDEARSCFNRDRCPEHNSAKNRSFGQVDGACPEDHMLVVVGRTDPTHCKCPTGPVVLPRLQYPRHPSMY